MEPELPQSESNTASDHEQFDAESNDLKDGNQICQGAIKREEAAGCANPTPWVDGDPIPGPSAPKPGHIMLNSMQVEDMGRTPSSRYHCL
ncbi:hypothetical protein N7452_005142 [Penicillium brevicompactum]|uniref:Uncharacterized protein n=1 Tax=Penicillium brevicompactum TaxID=5074 RepID=A0A9W9QKV7_PENBR|nr:hypothetical protein N7452_005142 [Penicillium brevicompactum]